MNDLDIILSSVYELDKAVLVERYTGETRPVEHQLELVKQVALLRKDVEVYYLARNIGALIAPCLCVRRNDDSGVGSCTGCTKLEVEE